MIRQHLARHALVLMAYCLPMALLTAQEPASWKAGAAKINITPEKLLWMSGYGSRDRPAEGKLTDLWAKALCIEDGSGSRAVFITLDLIGIDQGLSQEICVKLKEKYGLERSRIAICTSHTHTGPAVGRNLGAMLIWRLNEHDIQQLAEYGNQLVANVVKVVGESIEHLQSAKISWGNGQATFASNRRNNAEANVPELRTKGELKGPSDHDVPVLAVHDATDQLKAVLFGYACHSTVLSSYQWSGDYPAFAQMELEAWHPDCVALFWAGCGADQNPVPRRNVEQARHYGRRLADAVDAVLLTTKMSPVSGKLGTNYREVDLAFGPLPTRDQIVRDSQSKENFVASRARLLLKQIETDGALSQTYPYPISTWTLGDDLQFIALGGEVVVDFAIRLKAELRGIKTWVAGYSHDVMAYIPSRRVLTEGGYEGGGAMLYYGLPTVWAPEVEETIIREVHQQLK